MTRDHSVYMGSANARRRYYVTYSLIYLAHTHAEGSLSDLLFKELNHHWFRQWLGAYLVPKYYLNQSWHVVNWTLGNNYGETLIYIQKKFLQENLFANINCQISVILIRSQYVNWGCWVIFVFCKLNIGYPPWISHDVLNQFIINAS